MVAFQEHWGPFVFLSFLVAFQGNTILHLPVIIELSPFLAITSNFSFLCRHGLPTLEKFFFSPK